MRTFLTANQSDVLLQRWQQTKPSLARKLTTLFSTKVQPREHSGVPEWLSNCCNTATARQRQKTLSKLSRGSCIRISRPWFPTFRISKPLRFIFRTNKYPTGFWRTFISWVNQRLHINWFALLSRPNRQPRAVLSGWKLFNNSHQFLR